MLTADTITDEQIRDAARRGIIPADLAMDASGFDFVTGYVTTDDLHRDARARCAEILNARADAEVTP